MCYFFQYFRMSLLYVKTSRQSKKAELLSNKMIKKCIKKLIQEGNEIMGYFWLTFL